MALINQKLYKVTAYFVSGHRGFEPKMASESRMFEWQFIYVEVSHRASDQQITFGVTEKDLVTILVKLRQKARVEGSTYTTDLLHKNTSRESLLDFILDCFVLNSDTKEVSLSMVLLSARHAERTKLEENFVFTGGKYISLLDGEDPELEQFKTSVYETELSSKLIQNT